MAGLPASFFWSIGVNPSGSLIIGGSSCLNYLDVASLLSLNSIGAEPLASATFSSSGSITLYGLVPASPSVAGMVVGLQALVVDPAGTLPLGGGLFGEVSNGLQLTLGY